jgi:dTMP kinase
MRGLFITFEGIEGSGKTTLISSVADSLRRGGHDPVLTREPGGTDLGMALRKVLLDPGGTALDPVTELMLFGADRAQHVTEMILPALEAGRIVLCDRFADATLAYQGFGRGIDTETVRVVGNVARKGTRPDMTVLLDLPVETGLARVGRRNSENSNLSESRIDGEEIVFHSRVREGYLSLAGSEPDRFLILDAGMTPSELTETVMKEIAVRFADVF